MARCIWGEIYGGAYVSGFTVSILIFFFVLIPILFAGIFGYFIFSGKSSWIYFVFLCPLYYEKMSVPSPFLLCLGRRERFVATLVAAMVRTLGMIILVSVTVLLTIPLSWIMPSFTIGGHAITFQAIPLLFCCFPLLFVPQGLAWSMLLRGGMISALPTGLLNVLGMVLTLKGYGLLFILGSWVFLILVSYWISKKWSLVRT
jgi:hypothetical protein